MSMFYRLGFLATLSIILLMAGCARNTNETQTEKPTTTDAAPSANKTKGTGSITATPNPIKVCDGSRSGITTLSWTSTETTAVEVRVGKPDGDLFAKTGPDGSWKTGKWVGDGMIFYLQDVSANGGKHHRHGSGKCHRPWMPVSAALSDR